MQARPLPAWPANLQSAVAVDRPAAGAQWDASLTCVAGFILTSVGRIHQLFPVLSALKPALVTGTLAVALYLASARGVRAIDKLWSPTTRYTLLVLLWVALSVPGALWQRGSFELLTDDFIKTVVMYLVIVGTVRAPRDVERLVCVYFFAAVLYAAVVLWRFDLGQSGRLANLYYYDANDFATFVVTALPFGLYFLLGQRRVALRTGAAVGLVLLIGAFVRTGSRGGFLALLGVAAFFVVGYSAVRARWRILGTAAIALLFSTTASDSYWERMRTILHPEEDYNYSASGGRWQLWQRGAGYMLQHPFLGVGAGNFATAEGTLSPLAQLQERGIGVKWSAAHNSFVQIGAELGVPGLLFFVGVIASAFGALRAVRRVERTRPPAVRGPRHLALPLMASLIGFVGGAMFLSLAYQAMLYTLAALAVGLRKVTPVAPAPAGPVSLRR